MRFACLLLAAALSAACPPAAAQAGAPGPAPLAGSRHFLWEVSSFTNKVYLYGTVHAGKAGFYPLPEPVQRAFEDSGVLAVEADITDSQAMSKDAPAMTYEPPDALAKHVPAPVYERLQRQLRRLGVPEENFRPLKPFFAASLLVFSEWFRQGYLPEQGVDVHLLSRARKARKAIVELEGAKAQSALMASLSEKEGVQALEGAVLSLESGYARDQITGVVNAWQAGDPKLLLEVMHTYNAAVPGAREMEEKFIWSRHEAMADKVEAFLLSGRERVFVAVGALHLAGPRGLVEVLKGRGYTVRQL